MHARHTQRQLWIFVVHNWYEEGNDVACVMGACRLQIAQCTAIATEKCLWHTLCRVRVPTCVCPSLHLPSPQTTSICYDRTRGKKQANAKWVTHEMWYAHCTIVQSAFSIWSFTQRSVVCTLAALAHFHPFAWITFRSNFFRGICSTQEIQEINEGTRLHKCTSTIRTSCTSTS